MDQTSHDSAYSWVRLALSLGLSVVGSVGMWSVVVVLPDMQAELGLDRADATLPFVAMTFGFASGNLTLGRAIDRYGITPVMMLASIVIAVGFTGSALATHIIPLTALHVLLGLGAAVCFGPLMADVSQWFLKRRGIAVALTASGNYLSGTVWPPIIVWISDVADWRAAYIFLAVVCLLVLMPGALLLRRQIDEVSTARATEDAARQAASTGLSPRTLQVLLAVAGLGCCVAMAMPQVHIVALCIDRGFGARAGAEMLSLMLAGGVVSRLLSGWAADKIGGLPILLIGSVLQTAALCLFLIEGGMASLYMISLAFGLSQGGIVPSYAIIVREYMPPREAGRRVGIVMFATILGMALGGWLSGWLYDLTGSYAAAIWNGIGWNLMNAAIALTILFRIGQYQAARG
ncbi:MAG: MFS transporter [Boseongicola sp.]